MGVIGLAEFGHDEVLEVDHTELCGDDIDFDATADGFGEDSVLIAAILERAAWEGSGNDFDILTVYPVDNNFEGNGIGIGEVVFGLA